MVGNPRVLSIQSHVVSGYVGNKSATFPLQLLGFEVDAINSVQFSNHTGYKVIKGQIINEKELTDLIEGLKGNGLDNYTHLLTGFTVSEGFLREIANIVKYLKDKNSNLLYVCDPVMGDNGKMYVPEALLPVFRDVIIPLADIITPNQFELELLSGTKIENVDDAWKAIDLLHKMGCQTIVVSSSELGNDQYLLALASIKTADASQKMVIKIPKLSASFTGTGDLFAALTLAWSHKTNNQLKETLEKVVSTIHAVLKRTLDSHQDSGKPIEMKLIDSKRDIENPKIVVSAESVF